MENTNKKENKNYKRSRALKRASEEDRKGHCVFAKGGVAPVNGFGDKGEEKRNKTDLGCIRNQATQQ